MHVQSLDLLSLTYETSTACGGLQQAAGPKGVGRAPNIENDRRAKQQRSRSSGRKQRGRPRLSKLAEIMALIFRRGKGALSADQEQPMTGNNGCGLGCGRRSVPGCAVKRHKKRLRKSPQLRRQSTPRSVLHGKRAEKR